MGVRLGLCAISCSVGRSQRRERGIAYLTLYLTSIRALIELMHDDSLESDFRNVGRPSSQLLKLRLCARQPCQRGFGNRVPPGASAQSCGSNRSSSALSSLMMRSPLRIGSSGLRSSWDSVAKN